MELSQPAGTPVHLINSKDTNGETLAAKKPGHSCFHCGLVAKTKKSLGAHIEHNHLDSAKILVKKIRMSLPLENNRVSEETSAIVNFESQLEAAQQSTPNSPPVYRSSSQLEAAQLNSPDIRCHLLSPHKLVTALNVPKQSSECPVVSLNSSSLAGRHHCATCGYIAVSEGKLKVHLRSHTGEKPYSCSYCDYACSHKSGLNAHTRKYHTHENLHCCPHCSYRALRRGHLERHIRSHTGEKPFPCKMCDSSFSCLEYLNDHVRDFHYRERLFACPHCNKKLSRPGHLQSHLRTHIKKTEVILIEKPDAVLVDSPNLSQDSVGDLLKAFDGTIPGNDVLESLKNSETESAALTNQFSCQLCNFKCLTPGVLVDHVETHKKAKPFACTICPFRCKLPAQLTTHIALHTGDKPFKCPHCDARFTLRGRLNQHIIIHREDKRLKCDECDYVCFYQSDMRKHKVKHAKLKLSCSVCFKKFSTTAYLTQHFKRVHNSSTGNTQDCSSDDVIKHKNSFEYDDDLPLHSPLDDDDSPR